MKKILLLFLILTGSLSYAGNTTVTATVQDPTGQGFINCSVNAQFRPTPGLPGPFTVNGASFPKTVAAVCGVGTGTFSMVLTDNFTIAPAGSQWDITVCSYTTAQCFTGTLAITGASVDISTQLNSIAPEIQSFYTWKPPVAYSGSEIRPQPVLGTIYYNSITNCLQLYDPINAGGFFNIGCITGGAVAVGPHNLLSIIHVDTLPYSPPIIGDMISGNIAGQWARFGPNTTIDTMFLTMTGDGINGAIPLWMLIGGDCLPFGQPLQALNTDGTTFCMPSPVSLAGFFTGPQTIASQVLWSIDVDQSLTCPANFGSISETGQASSGHVTTAATASTVLDIQDCTTSSCTNIGTCTIGVAGKTCTFATSGGTDKSIMAGHWITVAGPASADATAADFHITLSCYH